MKIAKNFYKNVPIEKRKIIHNKLNNFAKIIIKSRVFSDIPNGYWIRRVAGTDIYKFRINRGDRILFRFDKGTIIFLSYETHDNQILSAKLISHVDLDQYEIKMEEYEDEVIDIKIDQYVEQELLSKLYIIEQQDVLDDEYISLMIKNPLLNTPNVLTREQFECLTLQNRIIIVHGCAGSGKTSIAIRKLLLNEEMTIPTVYVSHTPFLMNEVRESVSLFNNRVQYISFCSLQQLYENVLQEKYNVVNLQDFSNWYKRNELQNELYPFSPQEIFIEINTVIKGESQEKELLSMNEYLSSNSFLSIAEKKYMYFISNLYQQWLQSNEYVDLNDLATLVLKERGNQISVIVDEMQELTLKQLDSIIHLSIKPGQLMLLGDHYQAFMNYKFSIERLKKHLIELGMVFQVIAITKNFRSSHETVMLLNAVKKTKQNLYPSSIYKKDCAVYEGGIPKLLKKPDKLQRLANQINQNPNAIVIVENIAEKEKLKQLYFDRVFLIDEIQGLQYIDVFCFNMLQSISENLRLKEDQDKWAQLNSLYYNHIYLAASRSIQNLYLIEEEESGFLIDSYMSYFEEINLDILLSETIIETATQDWYEEGQRLKLLGKYEQAIDAFTKADAAKEIRLCKNLLVRSRDYNYLQKYEAVLKFELYIKDEYQLIELLTILEEQYDIRMVGNIFAFVTKKDGFILSRSYYLEPNSTISERGKELFSLINYDYAKKNTLFIVGCFYRGNEPVHLQDLFGLGKADCNDLIIQYQNIKAIINIGNLVEQRAIKNSQIAFDNERYEWQGLLETFNVDIHREKVKNKKSAEDFLADIFE